MKKIFILTGFLLSLSLLLTSSYNHKALADGMMIKPDPYSDRWDYANEENQQAYIKYDRGMEKMIISISYNTKGANGAVWLFPIPAKPKKVAIDVLTKFPDLGGEEISRLAERTLDDTLSFAQRSQIYPDIFIGSMLGPSLDASADYGVGNLSIEAGSGKSNVTVHEHLEKEGITSELITAETANSIYDYLKDKDLNIKKGSIPVLDSYIGKDYSFVVSWITNRTEEDNIYIDMYPRRGQSSPPPPNYDPIRPKRNPTGSEQRGIYVTFPTNKLYYPLMPTSVYGSEIVPATIRVFGYAKPKIFKDIKSYTETEYYIDEYARFDDEISDFHNKNEKVKYTKIKIEAPSKFLTKDLWISRRTPIKAYYSNFFADYELVSGVIVHLFCSGLTGWFIGMILFKELRNKPKKLILISLFNLFTILGLAAAVTLTKTKEGSEDTKPLLEKIKTKGYIWKRKLAVILFLPLLPMYIIWVIFFGPVWLYAKSILGDILKDNYYNSFDLWTLFISMIFPLSFIAVLWLRRIKKEDKKLFKELKEKGYSKWSFKPKDSKKWVFVPLFSVCFLVISWIVVKFLKIGL